MHWTDMKHNIRIECLKNIVCDISHLIKIRLYHYTEKGSYDIVAYNCIAHAIRSSELNILPHRIYYHALSGRGREKLQEILDREQLLYDYYIELNPKSEDHSLIRVADLFAGFYRMYQEGKYENVIIDYNEIIQNCIIVHYNVKSLPQGRLFISTWR
jgi:hypothetical protein